MDRNESLKLIGKRGTYQGQRVEVVGVNGKGDLILKPLDRSEDHRWMVDDRDFQVVVAPLSRVKGI